MLKQLGRKSRKMLKQLGKKSRTSVFNDLLSSKNKSIGPVVGGLRVQSTLLKKMGFTVIYFKPVGGFGK